jgi:hypothetical protein
MKANAESLLKHSPADASNERRAGGEGNLLLLKQQAKNFNSLA